LKDWEELHTKERKREINRKRDKWSEKK
jgi:hypothetical protein